MVTVQNRKQVLHRYHRPLGIALHRAIPTFTQRWLRVPGKVETKTTFPTFPPPLATAILVSLLFKTTTRFARCTPSDTLGWWAILNGQSGPERLAKRTRHTQSSFLTSGYDVYNVGTASPDSTTAATSPYMTSLLVDKQILDVNNNRLSEQWMGYDGTGLTAYSAETGHNSNRDGSSMHGNPTTISNWLNSSGAMLTTQVTYDVNGNIMSVSDPNGHRTAIGYTDCYGDYGAGCQNQNTYAFKTALTNPKNQTARTQYDFYTGHPTAVSDVNGVSTAYSYSNDPLDRLIQERRAAGTGVEQQLNFSYTPNNGNPAQIDVVSDLNNVGDRQLHTSTLYDGFGNPLESRRYEDASHYISTQKTYDALGRVATATNPSRPGDGLNYVTSYFYDALGRTTSVQTADGLSTTSAYAGNQITTVDQAGAGRSAVTDALGRLIAVREDPTGLNYLTQYSYDALGNLVRVSQGNQVRSFGYDSLSRLMWSSQPETGALNYHYNAVGNVIWRDDNAGQETCYAYDELNRLTQKVYYQGNSSSGASGNCAAISAGNLLGTPAVNYQYGTDPSSYSVGRLLSVTNGSTMNYSYDPLGQVTASMQQSGGQSYSFTYGYNRAGSLISETYPSGRTVVTSYDGADRANQVIGSLPGQSSNYVSGVAYAPHGALQSYTYGNGLARSYQYNTRLQPQLINDNLPGASGPALQLQLFWGDNATQTTNNNGNLRGQVMGSQAGSNWNAYWETYSYDRLNRITQMTDTGNAPATPGYWQRGFGYDQYGNMWQSSNDAGFPVSVGTPSSQSNIDASRNRLANASYDAAGNQTAVGSGVSAERLAYDAEGRVNSATTAAGVQTTYGYNGQGNRVWKSTIDGITTTYVYDAQSRLGAEYSTMAQSPSCLTCYLSWDHLGTTRLVTDQNSQVVSRHDYLPFGDELGNGYAGRPGLWGASDAVNQKFTGKERDSESGLDYFGARYYGAALGRFTSPDDPLADQSAGDPQSWNLYSYVRNNPLKNIDPSGQDCITTSSQTSSGVEVATERGGSAETCSGTYVNGMVNTNSYQYNGTSLSYSFGNDTASGAGTIAFSKYSNDDWAPGSGNMLGAAQIGGSQALVNEFMKQAAIGAAAGVAGRVIGAGVDSFLAARAARAAAAAVDIANLSNKIARQMASRGWTTQEIVDTVQNGKTYSVLNKATGGAATEYVNPASGKFVVVDNATKQVLQVSGPGFSPNHLIQ